MIAWICFRSSSSATYSEDQQRVFSLVRETCRTQWWSIELGSCPARQSVSQSSRVGSSRRRAGPPADRKSPPQAVVTRCPWDTLWHQRTIPTAIKHFRITEHALRPGVIIVFTPEIDSINVTYWVFQPFSGFFRQNRCGSKAVRFCEHPKTTPKEPIVPYCGGVSLSEILHACPHLVRFNCQPDSHT